MTFGNSLDKLRHPRSVAYSVELVLLNKHQISGGGAYLDCYLTFCCAVLHLHVRKVENHIMSRLFETFPSSHSNLPLNSQAALYSPPIFLPLSLPPFCIAMDMGSTVSSRIPDEIELGALEM